MGWNDNTMVGREAGGGNVEKYTLVIKDVVEATMTAKDGTEYPAVEFQFKEKENNFFKNKLQLLSSVWEDGEKTDELYLELRPGYTPKKGKKEGIYQPSTLAYEIVQLLKEQQGEEKIAKRKEAAGGYNRKFYKGCEFELECKEITKQDGTTDYIMMFEYERIQDEQYQQSQGRGIPDNTQIVEENDLKEEDRSPF